jgi:hypothetical protein
MIADTPVAAATRHLTLLSQVQSFVEEARRAAGDGLTWSEFGELLVALLRLSIATLDTMSGLSGAEKKELAVAAVAALFDTVADRAVPTVVWPVWLLARPAIRSLVLAMAGGAIEVLLPMVRSLK